MSAPLPQHPHSKLGTVGMYETVYIVHWMSEIVYNTGETECF